MDLSRLPFIPARLRFGKRPSTRLIVIHTAECGETSTAAEGVASWFQNPSAQGSAHATVDNDSVVQHMGWDEKAAHARGGNANATGIGIEHAGRAAQTAAQWDDDYSRAVLVRSAQLTAALAIRYGIPVVKLTPTQVAAGARGFCGHADVTYAYNVRGGHTDPGTNFPWDRYLELVRTYAGQAPAPADPNVDWAAVRRYAAAVLLPQVQALPTLRRGMKGGRVQTLQKALNLVANARLGEDGSYGPGTETAVRNFQRFFGLTADGVAGPKTLQMLAFCLARAKDGK